MRCSFLIGQWPIHSSSTNPIRTVVYHPSQTSHTFIRFSMGISISLILRSVRELVILFLPHFHVRSNSNSCFSSTFIFIRLTTDLESPAIAAMSLWGCVELNNDVFISLLFLETYLPYKKQFCDNYYFVAVHPILNKRIMLQINCELCIFINILEYSRSHFEQSTFEMLAENPVNSYNDKLQTPA